MSNMICSNCRAPLSAPGVPCTNCGEAAPPANLPSGALTRAKQPRIPIEALLYFILEATASSGPFRAAMAWICENILNAIQNKVRSIKVSVARVGDIYSGHENIVLGESLDPVRAMQLISGIQFFPPQDMLESHLDNLGWAHDTFKMDMGRTVRSVALYMGTDGTKGAKGRSPADIGKLYKDKGISVVYVGYKDALIAEFLAACGDFDFIPMSNNPSQDEIQRIAARISASVTATMTAGGVTAGGTVPLIINGKKA